MHANSVCHTGTDTGSRQASGSMNAKQPSSPVGRKCGSCGNLACRCGLPCDSMGRDHRLSNPNASRLVCLTIFLLMSLRV